MIGELFFRLRRLLSRYKKLYIGWKAQNEYLCQQGRCISIISVYVKLVTARQQMQYIQGFFFAEVFKLWLRSL